jgi:Uma2 family endonuclease
MEPHKIENYTYAEYFSWDDGKRYELIDGEIVMMTPAPTDVHQEISAKLVGELYIYLKGKTCKVFAAPFDVRLNADAEDDTVVQPDISVICDPSKIEKRGCIGAPDMIIEILSPSSMSHDRITKKNKYLQAGVKEYWIVNPEDRNVQALVLTDGKYIGHYYRGKAVVAVKTLPGCYIHLADIFPPGHPDEDVKGPERYKIIGDD